MWESDDLYSARNEFRETVLTSCADVLRRKPQGDGAGGHTHLPVRVEVRLCADVLALRVPQMVVEGGRPVVVANWQVRLAAPERVPDDLDVLAMDEVVIGRESYRVVSTDKGRQNALCLTCQCLKVS
jgi:hypothetical protein